MINTFIAAIVAMFFWGKSTKDIEEKTQLASKLRTFIYGVLALVVLLFYIKTHQVATVHHTIQVKGLKETVNANGELADTIATINLTNKFSSNITENYIINKADLHDADDIKKAAETGGLFMAVNVHSGPKYKLRLDPQIEKQIKASNGHLGSESVIGDYMLDAYSHVYAVNYMTSSIPSLIPFFPTFRLEGKGWLKKSGFYYEQILSDCDSYGEGLKATAKIEDNGGNKHEIDFEDYLREMYVFQMVACDTLTNVENYHLRFQYDTNFFQRMNFFTAADISQYTCDINLESDCYIQRMKIMYDIPIEINSQDSSMVMTSYSFVVKGDFLNKVIANQGGYRFHVKFPTLANLQLIRSLILTTLLTALVSLFFYNLFYLIRKWAIRFRDKHISQISVEKAKTFRIRICILLIIIMLLMVYIAWRIFTERPFHVEIGTLDWLYAYHLWIIFAIIVILCVSIYFLFRKAYNFKKRKE